MSGIVIDILAAVAVAAGFYAGRKRGILKVAGSILAVLVGGMIALRFGELMQSFIVQLFPSLTNSPILPMLSLVTAFIIVLIIFGVLIRFARSALGASGFGMIDQLLGAALLAGLFLIVYSILVYFVDQSGLLGDHTKATSATYDLLITLPDWAKSIWYDFVKPAFENFVNYINGGLDQVEESIPEQTGE